MTGRRTYRFPSLDRTGWILGLSGTQCVLIGTGIFTSGTMLQRGSPPELALLPTVLTAVIALSQWQGVRISERIGTWLMWQVTRRTQLARPSTNDRGEMPLLLADYEIRAHESESFPGSAVGVVIDKSRGTISGTLFVQGLGFSLFGDDQQDHLLDGWAQALAPFASPSCPVVQISISEGLRPAEPEFRRPDNVSDHPIAEAYARMLDEYRAAELSHSALATLMVDIRHCGRGATEDVAMAILVQELALFQTRLIDASLSPSAPLTEEQLQRELLRSLDSPAVASSAPLSLSGLAGLQDSPAQPRSVAVSQSHVKCDNTLHSTFIVDEWPRREVTASWLEPFLMADGGYSRSLTLCVTPIPPHRSRTRVARDSTKLATDEEQRSRAGFRIGLDHRKSTAELLEREAELIAGHVEFEYFGVLTVSAESESLLGNVSQSLEQSAAQAGLAVTRMDCFHDIGLLCTLPVPYLARSRWL